MSIAVRYGWCCFVQKAREHAGQITARLPDPASAIRMYLPSVWAGTSPFEVDRAPASTTGDPASRLMSMLIEVLECDDELCQMGVQLILRYKRISLSESDFIPYGGPARDLQ
jgi:hypothetical protein